MTTTKNMHARESNSYLAGIIVHMARLAYEDGFACGLTSAQWVALGYFMRANKLSRTLSNFAKYHATTRGSASQTIKSLVTMGFLIRTPSKLDKRCARFDLTEKGLAICDQDPFAGLIRAIAALPENHRDNLTDTLKSVLANIVDNPHDKCLGNCLSCRNLKQNFDQANHRIANFCLGSGENVSDQDIEKICMNHQPLISAIG